MDLEEARRHLLSGLGGTPAAAGAADVDWQDVDTFNAALFAPPHRSASAASASGDGPSVLAMLSDYAGQHATRVHDVERNLLRSAETGDPMRMLQLQRQYSQLMLQHSMAMKVVGKTVQAIDSITKLQ